LIELNLRAVDAVNVY